MNFIQSFQPRKVLSDCIRGLRVAEMRTSLNSDDDVFYDDDNANKDDLKSLINKITDDLSELKLCENTSQEKDKKLTADIIDKICLQLEAAKEEVLKTAAKHITSMQLENLQGLQNSQYSNPSVQFFGLDWTLFLSRWKKVDKKVFLFEKNLKTGALDYPMVCSVIRLICLSKEDLCLHNLAVERDSLCEEKLKDQLLLQQKMTNLGISWKQNKKESNDRIYDDKEKQQESWLFTVIRRKSQRLQFRSSFRHLSSNHKGLISWQRKDEDNAEKINIFMKNQKKSCVSSGNLLTTVTSRIRRQSCFFSEETPIPRRAELNRRKSMYDPRMLERRSHFQNISMLAIVPSGLVLKSQPKPS